MAISGLHLLVFWALLQRAARGVVALAPRAFVRRAWLRALLLELAPLLLMLLYGELVAWPTSALRAAWMVVGMRSAGWRARRGALGPALAASVGLILLWEGTDALFDPGLQLSVTAVAGLALGGQARQPKGAVGWVLGMVQASLAACAPWVAWHFGRLPALGLLLNLLAIPLSEWAMLSAMLGGLLGPGPVGEAALKLAGHAVAFIEALARACPHAGLSLGVAHAPLLALGLVLAALLAWRRRYKAALLATVAATLLAGAWPSDPPAEVVFLPVGQGDAILLLDGQGHSLLVDTGGSLVAGLDPGTRVVRPALLRRGVRRLDVLALSHGDADHTAGAEALIREFKPLEIWTSQDLGDLGPPILAAAREVGARVREAPRRAQLGGLEVRRVDPPWEAGEATGLSRNEQSVILEVGLRGARFLLTGDAEQVGEARALDELRPVHVLKVAHHGSRTSSSDGFLARTRARVAVVQAGRGNRFGHPHREVVAKHRAHGAVVLGTQGCGELSVKVAQGGAIEMWGQPGCGGQ
jgi:competence protein ComEC